MVKRKYAKFYDILATLGRVSVRWPVVCLATIFSLAFSLVSSSLPVHAEAKEGRITLTMDTNVLSIDLMPGNFGKSSDAAITVKTDNFSGYTLKIAANSNSTSLVNGSDDEIASISSAITEATFRDNDAQNNKWGYRPSQYISTTGGVNTVIQNTSYLPAPTVSGDLLDVTSSANSVDNSYSVGFGVKVDNDMPAGVYTYTYVLTAVANPTTYNITYNQNTTDGVSDMPIPNPQAFTLDGGTPLEDSYVTLSSTKPIRNDKKFAGWCDVATTPDQQSGDDTCSGNLYEPGDNLPVDQTAGPNITIYAVWVDTLFPVVWNQMGACEFHGSGDGTGNDLPYNITGSECQEYWDVPFIDTKIPLYNATNASKDYEIHFKIDHYVLSEQVDNDAQQTFVNTKVSTTATSSTIAQEEAPGLVVRRKDSSIEFSSKINNEQVRPSVPANTVVSGGGEVSIFRLDSKIYYSVNGGPLVLLQDITGFDQYFGLTTWFGAYPSDGCTGDNGLCTNAKRFIEATLSNMYIKLGRYSDDDVHTINFKKNDGTTNNEATYLVEDGNSITTLPEGPTYTNHLFQGWYTAQSGGTQVTASTIPTASTDYYAHWLGTIAIADVSTTQIALQPGNSETIVITNSSELEPYTFSSSNSGVASVDENTGEVTAVAAGSATITITGTVSGETKTIPVTVTGQVYQVYFDSQGGSAVSPNPVEVGDGGTINPLPTSVKANSELEGWYTEPNGDGTKLATSTVFGANTPTQYYANWTEPTYVCRIATTLHSETCNQSNNNGCRKAGWASSATIQYGHLVSKTNETHGAAYDCDVDYDGTFDDETERFYYFGTENGNAKFIYYKNMPNNSTGELNPSIAYDAAVALLPNYELDQQNPSIPVWDNPHLVTYTTGAYAGKAARFMTYPELTDGLWNGGTNGLTPSTPSDTASLYLFEKSNFANTNTTDGIWLEQQTVATGIGNRIHTKGLTLTHNSTTSANAARATIDVPVQYVQPYSAQSITYEITFDPHNETNSWTETIDAGDALGSAYPATDPTYTNHLFRGWFTAATGGTQISSSTEPSSNTTYHAQWLKTVTLATFAEDTIDIEPNGTATIEVTNSAELEPYTFSSSDTSVATVDSAGVITGVSVGTTNIVMTGSISGATKSLEVNVAVVPVTMYTVTFDSMGGSSVNSVQVQAGHALDTNYPSTDPTKTDNKFFGWYTDSSFNTEVTPETVVNDDVTYYARWIGDTANFPIKFAEINECTFNYTSNISGTYCTQPTNLSYIDTGIKLYSASGLDANDQTRNFDKDFEVGFTIVEFDRSKQKQSQATVANSKLEATGYPGFVFRRNNATYYQLTAKFAGAGNPTTTDPVNNPVPEGDLKHVRIVRHNNVMYYAWNGGELIEWWKLAGFTTTFETKLWFGAMDAGNDTPQRQIVGKLTDMYVRLGTYEEASSYTIQFDANGGTITSGDASVDIDKGDPIGSFPTVTRPGNYTFTGWFDENDVEVTTSTVPTKSQTYHAGWSYNSSKTPVTFDVSNAALRGYNTIVNSYVPQITTFNEADPINNSTWGVAKSTYHAALEQNYVANNCAPVPEEDSQIDWGGNHTVNCSKPASFDTGRTNGVNVYEYDIANDAKIGTALAYTKSSSGVIHNLIPGHDYIWEDVNDNTIYGVISAVSTANNRRELDVGDVWNVRDLGGLPVDSDGDGTVDGSIDYGKLIRGGRLNRLSSNITELQNLGIDKEYDLAGSGELSPDVQFGNGSYANDEVIHYNFDYGTIDDGDNTYDMARKAVTDIMNDVINDNNIYFHCRVGADRTGTIAYLLEGLLGVPDEQRYQDYEITSVSGLNDRTRYYAEKSSTNNKKFLFMMGFVPTNADILAWYLKDTSDTGAAARIAAFKQKMIVSGTGYGGNGQQGTSSAPQMSSLSSDYTNDTIGTSDENKSTADEVANTGNADAGYESPLGVSETTVDSTVDSSDSSLAAGLALAAAAVVGAGATAHGIVKRSRD